MAENPVRVTIPENPDELIALMKAVIAKHTADGTGSVLNGVNMTQFNTKTTAGDTQNVLAKKLRKDSETATESRDLNLGIAKGQTRKTDGTALFYLVSARDVLLGVYKGREQNLGNYGFIVDTSPRDGSDEETPTP